MVKKENYGIDAPLVVRRLFLIGLGYLLGGVAIYWILYKHYPLITKILVSVAAISAIVNIAFSLFMLWSSLRGKLLVRDKLIDSLQIKGSEHILDVGCGRGLLLLAAAKRLTTGSAVGLDLWRNEDLNANNETTTLDNIRLAKLESKVKLVTADMTKMPFPDHCFDVVVAANAIHNISDKAGRALAIREIARVLKPGGKVALLDFQKTPEYAALLQDMQWQDVVLSARLWLMFPPVRVVRASKPIKSDA